MKTKLSQDQILSQARKSKPAKKRVTFFIPEVSQKAFTSWCRAHRISASAAIDAMIQFIMAGDADYMKNESRDDLSAFEVKP